jgi:3-deoxy-manno-octulosonate cytidylyltransferase (CMP-KDO synthetase)
VQTAQVVQRLTADRHEVAIACNYGLQGAETVWNGGVKMYPCGVAGYSDDIMNEILSVGGSVKKSTKDHQSGSDRIAEAIASMDVGVVVNIQGDEPFIEKEPLQDLLMCFEDPTVAVASIMKRFGEGDEPENPNQVKVVCNKNNDALYFSRSPIPFKRNRSADLPYFKHVGVYAYRKEALLNFTLWPVGALEQTEMLEQLRYLENGVAIRMVETKTSSIGIDTPEDLERARIEYKASLKGF